MKLRMDEDKPLLYFSGTGSYGMGEVEMIKAGAKYRCFSYAYVCPGGFYYQKKMEEALHIAEKSKLGIMMDSSAHSFHRLTKEGLRKSKGSFKVTDIEKLRDTVVNNYAKFVKKNYKLWDFPVTFDYIKDCPTIYKMTKQLEKLGADTIPVFHGDKPADIWLRRYCEEGYKLVGIGSVQRNAKSMRRYYDKCFSIAAKYGTELHGLAVTSLSLMYGYPWYSVDSATWAKVAAYGCILCTTDSVNDSLGYIHLTDQRHGNSRGLEYMDLSRGQKKDIRNEVESNGFDLDELIKDGAARSMYNVYTFSHNISHLKQVMAEGRTRWKSLLS